MILHDGGVDLKKPDIQSALTSQQRVNHMFDGGARENFMAQFIIMSFHYRTHLCV